MQWVVGLAGRHVETVRYPALRFKRASTCYDRLKRECLRNLSGRSVFSPHPAMKVIAIFLLWCLLFAVCWPLALLVLILAPLLWLIALPFRLLGVCVAATFAFIKAVLFLPARILGGRAPA